MKQKNIILFGIFRSGTNYTRTVLEWNYECKLTTNLLGWKHGHYPVIVERSILKYPTNDAVFVTKNPFSTINSLFNYYQSNGRNIIASQEWKSFIRKRFIIYDYFQKGSPQYRFANIVDFWNSMNWNYASVQRPELSFIHVKYEDMLDNAAFTTKIVAEKLCLKATFSTANDFRIPEKITKNMGDKERESDNDYLTDTTFNKHKYTDNEYFQRFDQDDIDFILNNLDMDLIKHLGYDDEIEKAKNISAET